MDKQYQWLDWDSRILGYPVARLTVPQLSAIELDKLLISLQQQGVKLVYWAADSNSMISQQAAQKLNGFLADHKVTYLCNLAELKERQLSAFQIEEYSAALPDAELIELAYLSGLYSRFRTDPNISDGQFKEIYSEWITNSVNKQIANKVLIIKNKDKLAGMITLGEKQQRGDIGLLAVDKQHQSMGIGAALVQAAQQDFALRYQWSQVVTQAANKPACRLYERCGYQIEKIENFYHFWL